MCVHMRMPDLCFIMQDWQDLDSNIVICICACLMCTQSADLVQALHALCSAYMHA